MSNCKWVVVYGKEKEVYGPFSSPERAHLEADKSGDYEIMAFLEVDEQDEEEGEGDED